MNNWNILYFSVIAGFRGTVPHGLSLEIGDTVQILEKCDGEFTGDPSDNYALCIGGLNPINIHLFSEVTHFWSQ